MTRALAWLGITIAAVGSVLAVYLITSERNVLLGAVCLAANVVSILAGCDVLRRSR